MAHQNAPVGTGMLIKNQLMRSVLPISSVSSLEHFSKTLPGYEILWVEKWRKSEAVVITFRAKPGHLGAVAVKL